MSKVWTTLAWFRCSESRASSRNMAMNFSFFDRFGRTRLMATSFSKPRILAARPFQTSAMPPASSFSMMLYLCWPIKSIFSLGFLVPGGSPWATRLYCNGPWPLSLS